MCTPSPSAPWTRSTWTSAASVRSTWDEFLRESFDTVITVCDHAAQNCPHFPLAAAARPGHVQRIHWSLPDPAAEQGDEAQRLAAFGRVRDELGRRLRAWLAQEEAKARNQALN